MQDLVVWGILASELDSGQQCAAIIAKLQGGARVIARGLSMQEMTRGGVINGQHVNAVTFLLTQLAASYAPLGEEQRLQAMGDLMQFRRLPNESIDQLVVRFRVVRWRAQQSGNMAMSIEGLSWLLLCAVRPTSQQLVQILQPFDQQFPTTEQQFEQLMMTLRRLGHILENSYGNIATQLTNGHRNFAVFGDGEPQQATITQQPALQLVGLPHGLPDDLRVSRGEGRTVHQQCWVHPPASEASRIVQQVP